LRWFDASLFTTLSSHYSVHTLRQDEGGRSGMSSTYETVKVEHENGIAWVMSQFLDEKTYRPGIQPYSRPSEKAS
jgi:hypothetical protein